MKVSLSVIMLSVLLAWSGMSSAKGTAKRAPEASAFSKTGVGKSSKVLEVSLSQGTGKFPIRWAYRPVRKSRLWTWITLGLSAAALATGIGFSLGVRSAENQLKQGGNPQAPSIDMYEARRLSNLINTRARVANGMYILAAASFIGSVILFFVEGRVREPARETNLGLSLAPGGLRLSMDLRF